MAPSPRSGRDRWHGAWKALGLAAYQWLGSAPDFTATVTPASADTGQGGTASYAVSVAPTNGFTGDVSLSLSGLSLTQASWNFAPAVIPGGAGSAQLTVSTAASIPPGTYPLTVTAASGATVRTAAATLVVNAPADFGLAASPASRSVVAGTAATYDVGVTSLNGFTGDVSLSLSGLPSNVGTATFNPQVVAGAGRVQLTIGGSVGNVALTATGLPAGTTATFSPNPVGSPGSSTLAVRTTSATPRGTFTFLITGIAGPLAHDTSAQLRVR